ncbi:MAG: aminotransferase class I/II-fold pyridoxal phosphate-dependent enzyme [Candidatus Marinimicrobia bacterium]|nr:aminotransferase class I/II-fold pyridoxal phosphate-dependent enzyme [Candidatus Neomarinimicrobiota bacterium]
MIKVESTLQCILDDLEKEGTTKSHEMVIYSIKAPQNGHGPRYYLEGMGKKPFIRMNSNSYLGLSRHPKVIEAEERAAKKFGSGPGAVRFISGTFKPHIILENRLAQFHHKPSAMILSSAYVTSMGVIYPLITPETIVISDELNHNCIINAIRLSRPKEKYIYHHNDMEDLENKLNASKGKGKRVLVITDGVFSMRGDFAPLNALVPLCKKYDEFFEEGVISIVDDSHGVGAFGKTGRGTEEYTGTTVDILIGTLGKAFGVNGGYVTGSQILIQYLRETAPMYIYSNPITASEAAAAEAALSIVDSSEGHALLEWLNDLTQRFKLGVKNVGYETILGPHPIVPIMIRNTEKTGKLTKYLHQNGILATGLNYPVVPKGEEEIRFQISTEHTEKDVDYVLSVMKNAAM